MPMLRGPVLWPVGPHRLVALADGVVGERLPVPRPARPGDPPPEDGLIVPAFADWHFHFVQIAIAGQARPDEPLLAWLRARTWPAEELFANSQHARSAVQDAVRRLAAAGTLAGAGWGSSHAAPAGEFLSAAPAGFVGGPAVMTEGIPASLVRPLPAVLGDLERLHERFGTRLAVLPRFALSCGDEAMRALAAFAAERSLVVTTHLAENVDEVEAVRRRFPDARDYLDVYARAGLVTPRTLLAHVVHTSDSELTRIAASGAAVVHCPTSNRALGSGRMPLERVRRAGVRWVLGSDVGAGPELCLLDVISTAQEEHQGKAPLTGAELLHRATLGRRVVTAGTTEADVACGERPGALVVAPPDGMTPGKPDGEAWLGALVAAWRRNRGLAVRRVVTWSGA